MKNNIYDLIISELVIDAGATTGSGSTPGTGNVSGASLSLTTLNSLNVGVNMNTEFVYTSTLYNMPVGYTVQSHSITSNGGTIASGATGVLSNTLTSETVNIPTVGGVYIITSTATLISQGNPNIIVSSTLTITAVNVVKYGLLPLTTPVDISVLQVAPMGSTYTIAASAVVGRITFVIPGGVDPITKIIDNHGMQMMVSEDFTMVLESGNQVYTLDYDTQIISGPKTFTIKH